MQFFNLLLPAPAFSKNTSRLTLFYAWPCAQNVTVSGAAVKELNVAVPSSI